MPQNVGVLLLNLGGPDSPKAVKPFLYNLFSDPDILKLPGLLQKPLAWWIATSRTPEVVRNYGEIGGRSPILPMTQAQGDALQAELRQAGYDVPIYIAMRYWHPFTEETVDQIIRDGVDHLVVLPLYPHFSLTTTGSSVNALEAALSARQCRLNTDIVPPYYLDKAYLASVAETIQEAIHQYDGWTVPPEQVTVLFSAHSLPRRHIKRTQDPYPDQIYDCAKTLMATHFPHNPWELAFQSKVGKMPWIGPQTDGLLHYFAATGIDNIVIVPISFVSDHIETLFEIDKEYIPLGHEIGLKHVIRTPSLNTRPAFISALAQRVIDRLAPLGLNTTCAIA